MRKEEYKGWSDIKCNIEFLSGTSTEHNREISANVSKCDMDDKSGTPQKTCQLITDGPCSTNFAYGAMNSIMSINSTNNINRYQ